MRVPLLSLLLLSSTAPAIASEFDDIIVTARGRAEPLARVPDTVTAYGVDALAARKLTTIDEVIAATPGIFMINDQDPGTNLISVRGVSTNRNQAPSIAFVVDGLALPDAELFTLRTFDLARVEVLKGPQGALFGRSASGGAINIITQDPGDAWSGFASAGFGNGETFTADAALNVPLGQGVAARLSGSFLTRDGFITNTFLSKKVDGFASRNLRLKTVAELSEATKLSVRLAWAQEEGGAAYISSGNVTGLFGGRLDGAALTNPFGDFEGRSSRRWWGVGATLESDIDGVGTLKVSAGWDDYHKDFVEELDFRNDTPLTFFGAPVFPTGLQPIAQPVTITAATLEARLTSPDAQPLRWNIGLFAQDSRRDRTDDFGPLLFGFEAATIETRSTQLAGFGQLSYDLTDTLEVTGALRYDRDERSEVQRGAVSSAFRLRRAAVFDKWQPKLSLAWRPSDALMLYSTGAIGFKTGGFNPLPGPGDIWQADFAPERTRALEAGVKAQALGGAVRVELAGFITDYANFQNTVFLGGNSVVLSVPNVDVHGAEALLLAALGGGFDVNLGVAWARSRAGTYTTPNPTPQLGEPAVLDLTGTRTPNAPELTLTAGGQWQGEVGAARLSARLDATRVSRVHYEIDNILYSPAYVSVDGRLAVSFGAFEAELWAKNLFDQRRAISAFGQQQLELLLYLGPNGPFDSFTLNRGREFGGSIRWSF
jgi:iron complex outermembrane recepter protein